MQHCIQPKSRIAPKNLHKGTNRLGSNLVHWVVAAFPIESKNQINQNQNHKNNKTQKWFRKYGSMHEHEDEMKERSKGKDPRGYLDNSAWQIAISHWISRESERNLRDRKKCRFSVLFSPNEEDKCVIEYGEILS